jgi:CheY-like chemotaxis protein
MTSILVVDDRSADRELLATVLGHAGYRVREAATGDAALELEEQLKVLNDKLFQKVHELEEVNHEQEQLQENLREAEGQTAESLALLNDYGVDFAQGFDLGRPSPIDSFEHVVGRAA